MDRAKAPACLSCLWALLVCASNSAAEVPPGPQLGCNPAYFDVPPTLVHGPKPLYPYPLRRSGVESVAVARFVVLEDGRTSDIDVASRGSKQFAYAVEDALKQWRFKPALRHQVAVAATCTLIFEFTIVP